jgi:hypothetical protein
MSERTLLGGVFQVGSAAERMTFLKGFGFATHVAFGRTVALITMEYVNHASFVSMMTASPWESSSNFSNGLPELVRWPKRATLPTCPGSVV